MEGMEWVGRLPPSRVCCIAARNMKLEPMVP